MEVINGVVGVRWWIGSDSVYTNEFKKQQDYLLENSELHCHIMTNYEAWLGLCLCMVCRFFLNFQWPLFFCWPCVRVVKTQLGPSRPVSTAGSRFAVCAL